MIKVLTSDWRRKLDLKDESDSSDEDEDSKTKQPLPLLDLAAQATAKHYSSSEIDAHRSHLDAPLLSKVAYRSFPEDVQLAKAFAHMSDKVVNWKKAIKLLMDNRLLYMVQVGFTIMTYITKHNEWHYLPELHRLNRTRANNEIKVSVVTEKRRIISATCSECTHDIWCEHVIAAILDRKCSEDHECGMIVHAPMMDCLSILDRDQLQKLLQYAVNQDPAEILREIFYHFDESGNIKSEIVSVDGAPDPTCGGLQEGEKCSWDLMLAEMSSRYLTDLDSSIRCWSKYNHSEGLVRSQRLNKLNRYYPDNYDLLMKKESKFLSFILPVLALIKDEEYLYAALVMQRLIITTAEKMKTISRSECPNLSRLWHDVSHIHALLVLRTEDKEARNVLLNTANKIRTAVMREHILQTSDWSELPSLVQLLTANDAQLKNKCHIMIESVLANQLQPCPKDLRRLLDGTDSIENTSYNEDLIVMLARLESLFLFEKDQCAEKICRLGFLILRKLSLLAQKDSVIGCIKGSRSPIELEFCPGPPATSTKQKSESLVSSSSSNVQPMDTDSVQAAGEGLDLMVDEKNTEIKEQEPTYDFVWSCRHIVHAMLQTLGMIIHVKESGKSEKSLNSTISESVDLNNHKDLVAFCLQALELSRFHMHAVFNTSNIDTKASKGDSLQSKSERPLVTSSSQSESPLISQVEHDWCLKLETTVCDYLGKVAVEDYREAVSMYIDNMCRIGNSFYISSSIENSGEISSGVYPLVLVEMLCQLCNKCDQNKSKSIQLKKICSDILINSTHCKVFKSLLKGEDLNNSKQNSPKSEDTNKPRKKKRKIGTNTEDDGLSQKKNESLANSAGVKLEDNGEKYCTDFAIKKYHTIIETFLSLLEVDSREDVFHLIKILNRLECIYNVTLLQMIIKNLRLPAVRLKDNQQSAYRSLLKFSIHAYKLLVGVSKSNPSPRPRSKPSSNNTQPAETYATEKKFIFFLVKKIDASALPIFLRSWKDILTCKELQDLVFYLEGKNKKNSVKVANLSPKVQSLINEFFLARLPHDEDACTMLTRFFTPGTDAFRRMANKIFEYSEYHHAKTLFELAKLHHGEYFKPEFAASYEHASIDTMMKKGYFTVDPFTFEIVERAFKRLSSLKNVSESLLEDVEWASKLYVKAKKEKDQIVQDRNLIGLNFFCGYIECVCKFARAQPKVVFKVVQTIDLITGGGCDSFREMPFYQQLCTTLITSCKEYFENLLKDCVVDNDYCDIVNEMLTAEAICKRCVADGDKKFGKVVVQNMQKMHSGKKILMILLAKYFTSKGATKNREGSKISPEEMEKLLTAGFDKNVLCV